VDLGDSALSTGTALRRFFLSVMPACAELERNVIAERTAAALAQKPARRQVYSTVTPRFRRVGRRPIEVPEELALVAQIRAWRARGWSLHRIAAHLNAAGVRGK
jgi:DNA invertase Pin-like site-specific DNA recombinase